MIDGRNSDEDHQRRERVAALILVGHLGWCAALLAAILVSAAAFCGGNDDCHGLWIFVWGMLWILGEVVFFIPVVGATLYLVARVWRCGVSRAPMTGLCALAVIPVLWVAVGVALDQIAAN
jgi:hypothetical protein